MLYMLEEKNSGYISVNVSIWPKLVNIDIWAIFLQNANSKSSEKIVTPTLYYTVDKMITDKTRVEKKPKL